MNFHLRKCLVALALIFSSAAVNAQFSVRWKVITDEGADQPVTVSNFTSVNEAKSIINNIIDVMNLNVNFEVREANIPNAAAVFYGGKRYILYNPKFIKLIDKAAGTDWASISILAHEIGHHVKGHTFGAKGSSHEQELAADEFSGYALRKLGASLEDAQIAMKMVAGKVATESHPGQYDRLNWIAKGWNAAHQSLGGSVNDTYAKRTEPEVKRSEPVYTTPVNDRTITRSAPSPEARREMVLDNKSILVNVHFSTDKNNEYYVTNRYNVVRWDGEQLVIIGKLAKMKNTDYPFYIYDRNKNYVLISNKGYLVDSKGKQVGHLSLHTNS